MADLNIAPSAGNLNSNTIPPAGGTDVTPASPPLLDPAGKPIVLTGDATFESNLTPDQGSMPSQVDAPTLAPPLNTEPPADETVPPAQEAALEPMQTPAPQEPVAAESVPPDAGNVIPTQEPTPAPNAEPAPAAPIENSGAQMSSVNYELGADVTSQPMAETAAPEAAPAPEPELNIPPEIAAAKNNAQNIQNNPQQQMAPAKSKFPLIRIIIIAAAILVIVGGYLAYKHFTAGSSSSSDQTFISE